MANGFICFHVWDDFLHLIGAGIIKGDLAASGVTWKMREILSGIQLFYQMFEKKSFKVSASSRDSHII